MKNPKLVPEASALDAATFTLLATAKEFAHASDEEAAVGIRKPTHGTVAKMNALLEASMAYANARRDVAAAMKGGSK